MRICFESVSEKANLPEEAKKEVGRASSTSSSVSPSAAPDYHLTRTWIDFVLDLPWTTATEDNLDIANARKVLDEDHFGLTEVKRAHSSST